MFSCIFSGQDGNTNLLVLSHFNRKYFEIFTYLPRNVTRPGGRFIMFAQPFEHLRKEDFSHVETLPPIRITFTQR